MRPRLIVLLMVILLIVTLFVIVRGCQHAGPLIYVRLDDKSNESLDTSFPGSDIDAIELVRNGELVGTAETVVESYLLDGVAGNTNEYKDVSQLLGVANYDAAERQNYVSLGGNSAYVIVRMSTALKSGDTIRVCEIGAGTGGSAEPCTISIASSTTGPFTSIGTGAGQFEVIVPDSVD